MLSDITIIWLCFAVAVLFVVCGNLLAFRALRMPGTLICFGGLTLVGLFLLLLHPSLITAAMPSDVRQLRTELGLIRTQLDDNKKALASFRGAYEDIRSVLLDSFGTPIKERSAYTDNELLSAHAMLRATATQNGQRLDAASKKTALLEKQLGELNERLAQLQRRVETAEQRSQRLDNDLSNAQSELKLLRLSWRQQRVLLLAGRINTAKIASLHRKLALMPQPIRRDLIHRDGCGSESDIKLDLASKHMDAVARTGNFIVKSEQSSLVARNGGLLYRVDPSPSRSTAFIFAVRQFEIPKDPVLFRQTATSLIEEVLRPLLHMGPLVETNVFIRGGADRGGDLGPLTPQIRRFIGTEYHPENQIQKGQYLNGTAKLELSGILHNSHLPILRAAFTREILGGLIGVERSNTKVHLLEGSPQGSSEADRSVHFFLSLSSACVK